MNFQITRIRLASVGPEPARYDPLDLDLCRPDGTGPVDTVLFLPNTGGKTVLMRLLFSVLHPPIVERIGTEETANHKKNLLGYVLDRDTSHVVIEWRRVEDGRFADEEALVTGLAAEWRDGRRPAEPKPEDLKRLWYSVRGPVGTVGAALLTFEAEVATDVGTARRRLPLRRFQEQLEELKKTGVRAKVKALDEAYEIEIERLRPLQTSRAEAALRLSRLLAANMALEARSVSEARARGEEAKRRAASARNDERDAQIEAAKLPIPDRSSCRHRRQSGIERLPARSGRAAKHA